MLPTKMFSLNQIDKVSINSMKRNIPESSTKEFPLVSILIPCWGCKNYIAETIESALAQDYEPLEIIVVEDCGNDGTYEEALKFSGPLLQVYRNEQNLGQYRNKNRALELAKGPLIKYLDGDDLLEKYCLSTLVNAWLSCNKSAGIIFGQFKIIDSFGNLMAVPRKWGIEGFCKGKEVLEAVTRMRSPASMFGNVSPHLFDKAALERIGGFPNNNAGPGDIETFLKLLTQTDVFFVEKYVAKYVTHPGCMSLKTFGLRECTDYITMVEKLAVFFAGQQDLSKHLYDEDFIRKWKVWACGHNILPSFQHKLRGRPNQYEQIKNLFAEKGLATEFRKYILLNFIPYILRSIYTKIRIKLGLPQHRSLFPPKTAKKLSRIS